MLAFTALLAIFATSASAINYLNTGVHCGTTADATLSDCQALVNDLSIWEGAWTTDNTCSYSNVISNGGIPAVAYNVACHGDCCVYVAGRPSGVDYDKYTTREEAQGLLGCGDAGANKINGLHTFQDHGVCFSSGDGCGDCFDDSDFTRRAMPEKRSIRIARDDN